MGRLTTKLITN